MGCEGIDLPPIEAVFYQSKFYNMDLVCFSHLHWNFVYQRPQHLLSRFATQYRVFYVQEFEFNDLEDGYTIMESKENVLIVIPHLNNGGHSDHLSRQRTVINDLFKAKKILNYLLWYYTPLSLLYTDHLQPVSTVYDCMDELSAFKFANPQLGEAERLLFKKADLVFTGGNNLYDAKKHLHHNIHPFPSSIDKEHFSIARGKLEEMEDQANIPHPRLGFFGVIDERLDIELIEAAANLRPDWQFVIIGPVVKIDAATLPRNTNIHYLGSKTYQELPVYISGWDIALIPFALNESTRFISPTKTPEYLAAGKPVISSAIRDVVYPYGKQGLVHIIEDAAGLVEKAEFELSRVTTPVSTQWLAKVDEFLASNSWDITWFKMHELIKKEIYYKQHSGTKTAQYV